ncbi:MAG: class I SAM-dependent methyltransferase [Acidimicrobiales bacterium]
MALLDEIRRYWDDDAATYDDTPRHHPRDPAVVAAWTAALEQLLPPPPARVLDCGAGTGFLSLIVARLGHRVTALDLSAGMLGRLRAAAGRQDLAITVVEQPGDQPPAGPFDAVVERHLLWTLPDPGRALAAWRRSAPDGRLVLVESLWGGSADPVERLRSLARQLSDRVRRAPPEHHADYPEALRRALPLGAGTPPSQVVAMVAAAGWPAPRLQRLRDVEWAEASAAGARPLDRVLGTTPRYAVRAG